MQRNSVFRVSELSREAVIGLKIGDDVIRGLPSCCHDIGLGWVTVARHLKLLLYPIIVDNRFETIIDFFSAIIIMPLACAVPSTDSQWFYKWRYRSACVLLIQLLSN